MKTKKTTRGAAVALAVILLMALVMCRRDSDDSSCTGAGKLDAVVLMAAPARPNPKPNRGGGGTVNAPTKSKPSVAPVKPGTGSSKAATSKPGPGTKVHLDDDLFECAGD